MKMKDAFPSIYLKTDDVPVDAPIDVTISKVVQERVGPDQNQLFVAYFSDMDKYFDVEKRFVLKVTCWAEIATIVGNDDSDFWKGKKIQIYQTTTGFKGKTVPCLRCRPVGSAAPAVQPAASTPTSPQAATNFDFGDETIPDPAQDPPVTGASRKRANA